MKEIRRDMITGDMAIYSSYRNKRPLDKVKLSGEFDSKEDEYNESCPFCRGNTSNIKEIKEEIRDSNGEWFAMSVANKFPILDLSTEEIFGEHEVLIETYRHNGSYYNMTGEEFKNTFILMKNRYESLSMRSGIEYVSVFKNSKRNAGASLMHPHSQIASSNLIPPEVKKEIEVSNLYKLETGRNLYEDLIETEVNNKERLIYDGEYFIAFVPYATRYNGEVRIVEKDNLSVAQWNIDHINELSYIFENMFKNMEKYQGDIPFNILLHSKTINKEVGEELRTHFHIIPRKYNFGGFELTTGLYVCGSDPTELAEAFRIK